MRIAINGMFWTEPHVGSGQYLHNLVAHFAAHITDHRFVLVIPRYRLAQKPSIPRIQTVLMPTPFDRRNENLAKVWFEQIAINQVCRKLRINLLHVPYFGAPCYSPIPVVATVHDLIPLVLPEYRGSRAVQLYMRLAQAGARQARMLIADSHHTRHDIQQVLGVPEHNIAVTHLAASNEIGPRSDDDIAAARDRFGIDHPYIYYVGGFDARKNVPLLIRAFARARVQFDRRIVLAIAGRLPTQHNDLFPDIHRTILEEGVADDVVLLGPVSGDENAALLTGCEAFAYPSRYEGFGLPPLEAMQCGAPVLASSTTSVGEVVGDGGARIDPDDTAAWSAAIARVIGDRAWRDQLRQQGRQRARDFNWAQTARETIDVYTQALRLAAR